MLDSQLTQKHKQKTKIYKLFGISSMLLGMWLYTGNEYFFNKLNFLIETNLYLATKNNNNDSNSNKNNNNNDSNDDNNDSNDNNIDDNDNFWK